MRYIILLLGDESGWDEGAMSPEEVEAALQLHDDFSAWCKEVGVREVHSDELHQSRTAVTVHADGRETDGPFLELKEQLGGFYVIETDSKELAKEAARRCPNYGANELRPIVDHG